MMRWLRHRRNKPTLDRTHIQQSWQLASIALDYPTAETRVIFSTVRPLLEELPTALAEPLSTFAAYMATEPLQDIQSEYVDTFDVTRKCALHLTYFLHGDTRRRGVALVEFKQAYRAAGLEIADDELPDYLPAVLQCGAQHNFDAAWKMLNEHRVGIELVKRALAKRESPWIPALEAVRATLPNLGDDDEAALAKLIAEGPPSEDVGLDTAPYALDPRLNPRPEPIELTTRSGDPR